MPLASLSQVFWKMVGGNLDEWRAKFVDDFKREEHELAAFVDDEESRDTLRWILGLLQSFLSLGLSLPREFISQIAELPLVDLGADEGFKPYTRATIVLLAANATRKATGDPQRARDLLDVAFLELNKFRATLRMQGVILSPFPQETVEERRQRLVHGAESLRKALSERDWQALDEARMHNLR
jgi:hypothetical protein